MRDRLMATALGRPMGAVIVAATSVPTTRRGGHDHA
jgi:hypothetical protein